MWYLDEHGYIHQILLEAFAVHMAERSPQDIVFCAELTTEGI